MAIRITGAMIAAGLMLTACAREGDLGRYRATEGDRIASTIDMAFERESDIHSDLDRTPDEIMLRQLSESLLEPKLQSAPGTGVSRLVSFVTGTEPDISDYYERLTGAHRGSRESLLNAFAGHLQSDNALIDRFSAVGAATTKMDEDRMLAVRKEAAEGTMKGDELIGRAFDIVARVQENGSLITQTSREATRRIETYRYALVRVRTDSPAATQIEQIEKSLAEMETKVAGLRADADKHEASVRLFFGEKSSS